MEKKTLTFRADNQILVGQNVPARFASDTVSYIEAVFDLGENWSGFDAVKAVWSTDFESVCTVLDSSGACVVPWEVLERVGDVCVNLVGSISENDSLIDRLTTYPAKAITVDANATVCGSETSPITPSQFDQFAAAVRADADRAEAGATAAAASASSAAASATSASGSATDASQSSSGAAQSAQSASESADSAERSAQSASDSASDAEEAKQTILNMTATATTLPEGSEATVDYSNGVMAFGIPKGDTGARGAKGDTGETGATPNLSIGTVETLAPDEDATATITGTTEDPVLNLGIPKGDTGEVSLEDLETLLPTETASGSIVTITDGQAIVPAKSLKVALEPIQDLHGYDKPWAGGAGKNLLNLDTNVTVLSGRVSSAVTITSEDGSATITENYYDRNADKFGWAFNVESNQTYTVSGNIASSNVTIIKIYAEDGSEVYKGDVSASKTTFSPSFNSGTNTVLYFYATISSWGQTITLSNVQIEKGTATAYEPYSNICPISGHDSASVVVSGVNVWDEEWEAGGYSSANGEKVSQSNVIRSTNAIEVIPNTAYYIGVFGTGSIYLFWYDNNGKYVGNSGGYVSSGIKNTPSNAHYLRFQLNPAYGTTYENDISINYPSTDTSYHAYDGDTYTTALGRTVYGGTLDVVSGELVVDRAMVDLGTLSFTDRATGTNNKFVRATLPSAYRGYPKAEYSASAEKYAVIDGVVGTSVLNDPDSKDVGIYWYSDSGAPTDTDLYIICPVSDIPSGKMVYKLATPQTYQLTHQAIALLTGDNNVWSEDGSIEVKYRANIGLYVDKKISEVNA